ncbi:hypothetical protein H0H81_003440 [Sphagnurus paluster]|uniref:Uncharacterized protein n=1 Tax=Sphagnurus paluster TaxID=117069 RepID=A0A9P7FUY2_9AGAR|nr:hypothetical protein H0H81_003440 [Sphagnurus paluster]
MPKLRLKRTPEEEAAHQRRKKQRREEKSKRKHERNTADPSSRKRSQHNPDSRPWASSDDDDEALGPQPYVASDLESGHSSAPHTGGKLDYEQLRAELEEARFREKMAAAFEDDERLDSLEARLNDFAHVPGRWRMGGGGKPGKPVYDEDGPVEDEFLKTDPRHMDDEEYAEWIRMGMYRKTHADEYAEQQRKKAMKAQRREEEKARLLETQRLEKIAEEERKRKRLEREDRRRHYAREEYESRWKGLLSGPGPGRGGDDTPAGPPRELRFDDIPWPVLAAHRQKPDRKAVSLSGQPSVSLEHLTQDAIVEFLIPPSRCTSRADQAQRDAEKKERKDKLRETFLRFHPDKFEGRFMGLVRKSEQEAVREAIGQVVRSLNALMSESA